MIKFSFLKSLLDLPVADAEKTVGLASFKVLSACNSNRIAFDVPDTIFLEYRGDIIVGATVGDPSELDDDSVTTK